jgi:site-specific recombinase XerD
VTPHILRHTAITGLVKAGVDLPTIQRISGHKTLAMVLRYTQLTDDHIDDSVAKLDSAFSDAITPELHTAPMEARKGAA